MCMGDWSRAKKWGPLILISIIVLGAVSVAYRESPSWAVSPLEGLSTAGSLLLSAFLIYIYHRQNKILENQQEVMESEEEIQEVSQVQPYLQINWRLTDYGNIALVINNAGGGDAHDLKLVTEVNLTDAEAFGFVIEEHEEPICAHLTPNQSDTFEVPLLFRGGSRDDTKEISFFELSRKIYLSSRDMGDSAVEGEVKLMVSYKDQRDEQHTEVLVRKSIEFDTPLELVKNPASDLDVNRLTPANLSIRDAEALPGDAIGLTITNSGDLEAKNVELYTGIEIFDGTWISGEDYFSSVSDETASVTGTVSETFGDADNIADEIDRVWNVYFDCDGEKVPFTDMTEIIIKQNLNHPVRCSIQLEYDDGSGYNRSIEVLSSTPMSVEEQSNYEFATCYLKEPISFSDFIDQTGDDL